MVIRSFRCSAPRSWLQKTHASSQQKHSEHPPNALNFTPNKPCQRNHQTAERNYKDPFRQSWSPIFPTSAPISPPPQRPSVIYTKRRTADTNWALGGTRDGGTEGGEDKKEGNNRKIDTKPVQTWGEKERKKERDRALIRSRTNIKRNKAHTRSDQQKKGRGSSKGQWHKHTCRPLLTSSSSDEGGCCCTTGCWRAAVAGGSRW
jgi:hypothetical protein